MVLSPNTDRLISRNALALIASHHMTVTDFCRQNGWPTRNEEQQITNSWRKDRRRVQNYVIDAIVRWFSVDASELKGTKLPGPTLADAHAFQIWSPSRIAANLLGARFNEHEVQSDCMYAVQGDLPCAMMDSCLIKKYHRSLFSPILHTSTGERKMAGYNRFATARREQLETYGNPTEIRYLLIPRLRFERLVNKSRPYDLFSDADIRECLESLKNDMVKNLNIRIGLLDDVPDHLQLRLDQIDGEAVIGQRFAFRRDMNCSDGIHFFPAAIKWTEDLDAVGRVMSRYREYEKCLKHDLSKDACIRQIEDYERMLDRAND